MTPVPFRLDTVVWELTRACTFSCRYCGSRAGSPLPDEMGPAEQLGVADQLVAMRVRRVVLLGGEVFLKTDWERVAVRLMEGGCRVSVITNGWLVDKAQADHLVDVGIPYVAVSIDGTREVHDENRLAGSFDRAVAAVEELHSHGITTAVITTVNHTSAATLRELHATIRDAGADVWQIQACTPFGNAAFARELVPTVDDLREVVRLVAELSCSDLPILAADNIGYFTPEESHIRGRRGMRFGGCSAGLSMAGIDSTGNVRGCEALYDSRFIEGNLRDLPLDEIWGNPNAFAYNRAFTLEKLTGICSTCEVRGRCAGGCRSMNWACHGDTNGSVTCLR